MLLDRAYNQAKALIKRADEGVSVVLCYNPHSLNVYDRRGAKIDCYEELNTTQEIERCVPGPVRAEGNYIEGYVPVVSHRRKRPKPAVGYGPRRRKRVGAFSNAPYDSPSGG